MTKMLSAPPPTNDPFRRLWTHSMSAYELQGGVVAQCLRRQELGREFDLLPCRAWLCNDSGQGLHVQLSRDADSLRY